MSKAEELWYGLYDSMHDGVDKKELVEQIATALHSSRRAAYQKCLDAVPETGHDDEQYETRLRLISAALQHGFTLTKDGVSLE